MQGSHSRRNQVLTSGSASHQPSIRKPLRWPVNVSFGIWKPRLLLNLAEVQRLPTIWATGAKPPNLVNSARFGDVSCLLLCMTRTHCLLAFGKGRLFCPAVLSPNKNLRSNLPLPPMPCSAFLLFLALHHVISGHPVHRQAQARLRPLAPVLHPAAQCAARALESPLRRPFRMRERSDVRYVA
jgi:hypothetical protein